MFEPKALVYCDHSITLNSIKAVGVVFVRLRCYGDAL